MVVYMKKELCVKGFSAISDNEMLDVNGGACFWGICLGVVSSGIASIFGGVGAAVIAGIIGSAVGTIIDNAIENS